MPTEVDLKAALTHIFYVFNQTAAHYSWRSLGMDRNFRQANPEYKLMIIQNAALESTLVSLRALNEFFTLGGRNDDIRAEQFPNYKAREPFLSKDDCSLIHKHLAHLSWQRVKSESFQGWQPKRLMTEAILNMLHFLDYLEKEFLSFTDKEMEDVKKLKAGLSALVVR